MCPGKNAFKKTCPLTFFVFVLTYGYHEILLNSLILLNPRSFPPPVYPATAHPFLSTVNSPLRVQCTQAEHMGALLFEK